MVVDTSMVACSRVGDILFHIEKNADIANCRNDKELETMAYTLWLLDLISRDAFYYIKKCIGRGNFSAVAFDREFGYRFTWQCKVG